ncbi:CAP domain-containing protein [Streptomyces sp. NPDC026673]|uniref:CAP domain-containing protein n=1 Tax=Streptomyces sp. NPDC026673 TaxID=3155724 RepID=UPI0034069D11
MTKHRRTKRFRKITVAALAVAAVGVPSVAMACVGGQQGPSNESQGRWQHASWDGSWNGNWSQGSQGSQDSQGRGHWGGKPGNWGGSPSSAPSSAPSAPATAPSSAPSAAPSSPAAGSGSTLTGAAATVLGLVNQERAKAGCSALKVNAKLTTAAVDHSKDMASHKNMSHTGSNGSSPADRISSAGYNWSRYGENVAYGYASASSVMNAWMASPDHKRNILDCSFKEIGIGLAQPGNYWTQDFGAAR